MKVEIDTGKLFSRIGWLGFFFVLIRVAFIGAVFLYSGYIGSSAIKSVGGSPYSKDADAIRRQCRGNVILQAIDVRKWTPRQLSSNKEVYDLCVSKIKDGGKLSATKLKNTEAK